MRQDDLAESSVLSLIYAWDRKLAILNVGGGGLEKKPPIKVLLDCLHSKYQIETWYYWENRRFKGWRHLLMFSKGRRQWWKHTFADADLRPPPLLFKHTLYEEK